MTVIELLKGIGVGGFVLLLKWLSDKYNWLRQRPKEAIDVLKVEQEIKSDQVSTAIEVTNLMLTRLSQSEARLTYVQDENDKLRVVNTSVVSLMADTKQEMKKLNEDLKELLADLEECLTVSNCDEKLKHLRLKHGLDK